MKKYIRSERVNLFEPNDYIAMIVKLSGKLSVREMQKAVYAAFNANETTMSRVVLEPDGTAYFEKNGNHRLPIFRRHLAMGKTGPK